MCQQLELILFSFSWLKKETNGSLFIWCFNITYYLDNILSLPVVYCRVLLCLTINVRDKSQPCASPILNFGAVNWQTSYIIASFCSFFPISSRHRVSKVQAVEYWLQCWARSHKERTYYTRHFCYSCWIFEEITSTSTYVIGNNIDSINKRYVTLLLKLARHFYLWSLRYGCSLNISLTCLKCRIFYKNMNNRECWFEIRGCEQTFLKEKCTQLNQQLL